MINISRYFQIVENKNELVIRLIAIHEASHIIITEFSNFHTFPKDHKFTIDKKKYTGESYFAIPKSVATNLALKNKIDEEYIAICLAGYWGELKYCEENGYCFKAKDLSKPDFKLARSKIKPILFLFKPLSKYHKYTRLNIDQHWADILKLQAFMIKNESYSILQALDMLGICNANKFISKF